jgi:hypothetical protein
MPRAAGPGLRPVHAAFRLRLFLVGPVKSWFRRLGSSLMKYFSCLVFVPAHFCQNQSKPYFIRRAVIQVLVCFWPPETRLGKNNGTVFASIGCAGAQKNTT